MNINLPNEIWIIIVNTLGLQGYTRDCTNLIRALGFPEKLVYKYLVTELYKIIWDYNCNNGRYEEQMLRFWQRTGIDYGVSPDYIVDHLNSHTKMYKTIWAASVFENNNGDYCVFPYVLFDYIQGIHSYKDDYWCTIFKDNRCTPQDKVYFGQLSEKSKKEMENILENLNSTKQITFDGHYFLDRGKKLVLCKAKGSLI